MPDAMTLATAQADGRVSARMVLLKGAGDDGFRFFTNCQSDKARDLAQNPSAALVFWWEALRRQVRASGLVARLGDEESDAYFQSRTRASRIGAWASPQSRPTPHRAFLTERYQGFEQEFQGRDVPRPPHWGGFLARPDRLEFWVERPHRLHDRFVFIKIPDGQGWRLERLAP